MPRFKYLPLDNARQEIRLIRLPPDHVDNEVCVEIFHETLSLDHVPKYEALSYVWGSTQNPRKISACSTSAPSANDLGNQTVTENLWITLRHLRRPDSSRILWIDAICINQEDIPERSLQVGRMGLIYSKADQTIVWLGPASENSALAIETLKWISKDVRWYPQTYTYSVAKDSRTRKLEDDPKATAAKESEWRAVQDLLYRRWFTRLWIYQDIRLSQRAVMVVGNSELPWPAFQSAIHWSANIVPSIPLYRRYSTQTIAMPIFSPLCWRRLPYRLLL